MFQLTWKGIVMRVTMKMPSNELPKVSRMAEGIKTKRGRVVIATDTPVIEMDEQGKLFREVLLMDGAQFRGEKKQIPIVDSHDDSTVANVLGSVRNIQVDPSTGEMYGDYSFAANDDAQKVAGLIEDGHVTDFSITALKLDGFYVPDGKTYTTPRGVVIEGPAQIITSWEPHNASVCATGKDVNATVRRARLFNQRRERMMNEELLNQLIALGLPSDITDPQEIMVWLMSKLASSEVAEPATEEMPTAPVAEPADMVVESSMGQDMQRAEGDPQPQQDQQEMVAKAVARALKADQARRKAIIDDCTLMKVERKFAEQLIERGISVSDARKMIMQKSVSQEMGTTVKTDVRFVESEDDKVTSMLGNVLARKCLRAQRHIGKANEIKTEAEYEHWGMSDIATEFVSRMGFPVRKMAKMEIARAAAGRDAVFHRYRVNRADAYHTIGSFSSLMLDAQNKTLLAAYEEAPVTYQMWARQAESVKDFKLIHRTRMSESPDLDAIPESFPYTEGPITDFRESYAVQKYGKLFSVSLEAIINDDLDAFSRLPQLHGQAARRLQNKKVYEILTSNPVMSDTFNLFSASHVSGSNQSASSGAISVTNVNSAFVSMMTQKGPNGQVLGYQPRYLIVPVALSGQALQLINSTADPLAGGSSTTGNSNSANIYGPGSVRPISVVVEPLLDAASTTAWYMFADSGQLDTCEIAFLQGEESPVMDSIEEFDTDTWKYKVRQTFGVKAIDWRGAYRNS